MTGVICGTGSSIPSRTLDNQDISRLVDTSDAWIQERTGVVRRHIINGETTVSMAASAGQRAMEDAGIHPSDIDLILVATISSNVILPCTACEVQKLLGADRAVCFDLNAACSGFLFAYNTALCYLNSGMYKTVLVIGSESLSTLTNWKDRSTCILFGDGAGAVIIKAVPGDPYRFAAHSIGSLGAALTCRNRLRANLPEQPDLQAAHDPLCDSGRHFDDESRIQMDGRSVFSFAVKRVPEAVAEVLEANGLLAEEIDYFLLHQANRRIVEAVSKRMGIPIEKFPMNLQEYGNTSSASIPILIDEFRRNGTLKKGQKLVLAGFGAGLSWGASIIDWEL